MRQDQRERLAFLGFALSASGITSGMKMGFHLLRRTAYSEEFVTDGARVMGYSAAYDVYRDDLETVQVSAGP